jgi:uncharacterized protein (TIGR00369 family)
MTSDDTTPNYLPAQGFSGLLPRRIIEWTAECVVLEFEIEERHLNRAGAVHGGALMTLMDSACGQLATWAADPAERPRAATVSLSANFILPAVRGPLRITARNLGGGRSLRFTECSIVDADGRLCATGQASFRRFNGESGKTPSPDA